VSATVLYMSMSLDGFIAGPNEGPGNGLGDGGERLHDWLFTSGEPSGPSGISGRPAGINGEVFDEFISTGAVVAGRRTYAKAGNQIRARRVSRFVVRLTGSAVRRPPRRERAFGEEHNSRV
jgi:dihydrofolate reductase